MRLASLFVLEGYDVRQSSLKTEPLEWTVWERGSPSSLALGSVREGRELRFTWGTWRAGRKEIQIVRQWLAVESDEANARSRLSSDMGTTEARLMRRALDLRAAS